MYIIKNGYDPAEGGTSCMGWPAMETETYHHGLEAQVYCIGWLMDGLAQSAALRYKMSYKY